MMMKDDAHFEIMRFPNLMNTRWSGVPPEKARTLSRYGSNLGKQINVMKFRLDSSGDTATGSIKYNIV